MADYTKPGDDEILQILAPYSLGRIENISPMEGGQANSSFLIETDERAYILSICDEKNFDEIDVLTKVLEYLKTRGFPTSRIKKTQDGSSFVRYKDRPAYVKQYMAGHVIREITPAMAAQIGESLAKLHQIQVPEYLPDRFPYGLETFETIFDVDHPFVEWLKEKSTFLEKSIDPSMPKGLIHGDIFWDNLLFKGDTLAAVLDFEEACQYYKLYDLGVTAMGCCATQGFWDAGKINALIQGYRIAGKLSEKELSQLNIFMEYAAVAGAFWRFRQYNLRYPDKDKADTYKELSILADQIHDMGEAAYRKLVSPL